MTNSHQPVRLFMLSSLGAYASPMKESLSGVIFNYFFVTERLPGSRRGKKEQSNVQ